MMITFGILAVVLVIVFVVVFFPELQTRFNIRPRQQAVEIPTIKVDVSALDAPFLENLEFFGAVGKQFSYEILVKGVPVKETIFAASAEEALAALKGKGIIPLNLQESGIGRSEPFASY